MIKNVNLIKFSNQMVFFYYTTNGFDYVKQQFKLFDNKEKFKYKNVLQLAGQKP